jgi:uroporphyrinogen decarboxylase
MKGKERALRALHFEPVDRVPTLGGQIQSTEVLMTFANRDYWSAFDPREVAIEAYKELGADLIVSLLLPFSPDMEYRAWDVNAMFRYAKERYSDVEAVIEKIRRFPTPEELRRSFDQQAAYRIHLARAREQDRIAGDDILWLASGFQVGACRFMWYLEFGYENYFMLLADHKDIAERLFHYSGEAGRLQNEAIAAAILENDLPRFVYLGEDLCYNSGPMVSPRLLDEIYFPWLAHALEPFVRAGIDIIWHCDGNVMPILDRLLALGVTGFQGFQEDTGVDLAHLVSLRTIKNRRPILIGSVQARTILPFGTPSQVRREVERCIDTVGRGSGFVLAASADMQPEIPLENIETLYEHAREYGRLGVMPSGVNV